MTPTLRHPSPPFQSQNNQDIEEEEDKKEYEESKEDTLPSYNNNNNDSSLSLSQSPTTGWHNLQNLFNPHSINHQSYSTRLFLSILKDIFLELSPQTQICCTLISFGAVLILISLPTGILIGVVLLCIGISGITNIIIQKYIQFAQEKGLIHYLRPGIIKNFILNGSIVDIFHEIRNSRLGIPDFLLSQILPLDDPEREMIFERLPQITRDFVSTEGLIYLTPQAFQNVILPSHLQQSPMSIAHNDDDRDYDYDNVEDLARLSPISGSPNCDNQRNQAGDIRSLKGGLIDQEFTPPSDTANTDNINPSSSILSNTKLEIESYGKKWLRRSSSEPISHDDEDEQKVDERTVTFDIDVDEAGDHSNQSSPHSSHSSGSNGQNEVSWIGHVSKLFSDKMLGNNNQLRSKPMMKAVIDTRIKEMALQIIGYIWKSPFSQISDSQLLVIFVCCLGIFSYYLTKSREIRAKFVKSMKYMGTMMLFWIAILCFIELNIRRKSKVFNKIYDYINKQLFHSEHHKAVIQRKKSHELSKKSKSMRMYSNKSRSNLLASSGSSLSAKYLNQRDKKSKYSKTVPFINREEIKRKTNNVNIDSPLSTVTSVSMGSDHSSEFNTPVRTTGKFRSSTSLLDLQPQINSKGIRKRRPPFT